MWLLDALASDGFAAFMCLLPIAIYALAVLGPYLGSVFVAVALLALFIFGIPAANAQHNHTEGHTHYENWVNGSDRGCCNDQDCGTLANEDERTVAGKLEVRVEGEWCPVLSWMYLKKGNAPNWQTAHVCVLRDKTYNPLPVCARLICYQPRPLF